MRTVLALAPAVVCTIALSVPAAAQAPVAVVEDIKGKVAGIEFMDYVTANQIIKLGPKDQIVLGYMSSCWRETITGGTVVVGDEQSMVQQGKIERVKVECDTRMQMSQRETTQSAATVFRSLSAAQPTTTPSRLTLYGLSPVVEVKEDGTLVIARLDESGERLEFPIDRKSLVRGNFYDLAKTRKTLTPGGVYVASFGARETVFTIDPQAKPGQTAIVGRLLRFE